MITRIVKMEFRTEEIENFLLLFKEIRTTIASFEGCHGVKLLQDTRQRHIFFTFSQWTSDVYLNKYRHSEFFDETWKKTKSKFSAKPQAWTVVDAG